MWCYLGGVVIPSMVVVLYKWEVPEVDLEGWDPTEDSWHPSSICSR
jgi:hypothetical protein